MCLLKWGRTVICKLFLKGAEGLDRVMSYRRETAFELGGHFKMDAVRGVWSINKPETLNHNNYTWFREGVATFEGTVNWT